MSDNSNKRNKITIGVIAAILLVTSLTAFAAVSVNHYNDKNTNRWATVAATGAIDSDVFDPLDGEQTCIKGDQFSFAEVILDITDIAQDGTVKFSVVQGDLYNEAGEAVSSDSISKGVPADYKLNNGWIHLTVTNTGNQ